MLALLERVQQSPGPTAPQPARVRSSTSNLDYFVLRISDHPFAMTVEDPAELRAAFARQARRMSATGSDPACPCRSGP